MLVLHENWTSIEQWGGGLTRVGNAMPCDAQQIIQILVPLAAAHRHFTPTLLLWGGGTVQLLNVNRIN